MVLGDGAGSLLLSGDASVDGVGSRALVVRAGTRTPWAAVIEDQVFATVLLGMLCVATSVAEGLRESIR
jgi:hypothetical protein